MRRIFLCAALAVCVLFSGCASTDVKPESVSQYDKELVAGLVTDTQADTPSSTLGSEDDTPVEITVEVPVGDATESSKPVLVVPTAEVTTTPDADSDFNLFYSEVYDQFYLSEEEMSFVEYSLFVGDSICSGFSEYGIVSHDYVAAKGNLGSRSFFDYTFKFRGKEELTYDQVLKMAKPRYVFLSMGMNDVNMVYEDAYCENYRKVIEATLKNSNAEVFVAAITPVCSKFCANSVIDSFNDTIRAYIEKEFPDRVHYFDFGQYLKNERGDLRTCLHSGDGVHLGPYCYYIALWEMHRALMEAGLWDGTAPIGTFEAETEEISEPVITTAASTTKKQTKPQTSAKSAKTTKTTKQTTPKASSSSTTKSIPVDSVHQSEETTVQPQEVYSSEPENKTDTSAATIEAPPIE